MEFSGLAVNLRSFGLPYLQDGPQPGHTWQDQHPAFRASTAEFRGNSVPLSLAAAAIEAQDGHVQPIENLSTEDRAACGAPVLLVVGAASAEGHRGYNHALARCRAVVLAHSAEETLKRCDPQNQAPCAIWLLNLGPSARAASSDRFTAVLGLSQLPTDVDALDLQAHLTEQRHALEGVLGRSLEGYAASDLEPWGGASPAQDDLMRACRLLGR